MRAEGNGGIVPGDIILEVDGTAVDGVARLRSRLDERRIGDTVRLTVLRDGRKSEVGVRLQAGDQ